MVYPKIFSFALLALAGSFVLAQSEDKVDRALQTVEETGKSAAASQDKIDLLSAETRSMLEQYREATWKAQQLEVYNQQMQQLLASQESRRESLQRQVEEVAVTEREITPLMLRMIDALENFVDLDLPFLAQERRERVEKLRAMMTDSAVSTAERFRRVLEAYQVEADYGRSIEAYRGKLAFPDGERAVEFLRLGRTMLYYLAIDRDRGGYWSQAQDEWVALDSDYYSAIETALKVAEEKIAPQLLELPVSAPEAAQ